jgi:hypothetical protein
MPYRACYDTAEIESFNAVCPFRLARVWVANYKIGLNSAAF